MDIAINLFIVAFVIVMGLVAQFIFKKFKIPDALLLITTGAVLSYFGLVNGIKVENDLLKFLITFSLIYVVFYGALPIKLNALFSTMKYAFFSSILNFIIITGVIGIIAHFAGFSWLMALSLGALFCVLDGSVINSLLETINLGKKGEAQIQAEAAIVDILVIVGILSIINFSTMGFSQIMQSLTSYLFLSVGIGFVAGIVWALTLKKVGNYSSAPIATMAVLVIVYAFGEYVKANGVITVFAFSIILGNVTLWGKRLYKGQQDHLKVLSISTKHFFKDISFLIRTFLFVYLGVLTDLTQWKYILVGLGFFLLAFVVRGLVGRLVVNRDLSLKSRYLLEAMNSKGLTPIVLLAVIQGGAMFANIVVGGIFFSVFVSSILIFLVEKEKMTSFTNGVFWLVGYLKQMIRKRLCRNAL